MSIKVDKRLNLVVDIGEGGNALHVHSTPISRELFEKYWAPITRTFGHVIAMAGGGAPRVASLALHDVAEQQGLWDDQVDATGKVIKPGVKNGLLAEIRRLTNIVCYEGPQAGWVPLPLDVAQQQGKIDEDQAGEIENAVVFFTVASWSIEKANLHDFYETGCGIKGARTVSFNCTELAHSLRTSTATVSSGPKVVLSGKS